VIQPSQLLKDFGMTRIIGNDTLVSIFGTDVVFLLLVNVSDLEPDIRVSEGTWRVAKNAIEAGQRVIILALLFVDDAESKENLVSFIEIFVHPQDGGESLLGVIQRTIAVIKDADAIPKLGVFFRIWEEVKGLLVSRVRLLQIILHQIAMTYMF